MKDAYSAGILTTRACKLWICLLVITKYNIKVPCWASLSLSQQPINPNCLYYISLFKSASINWKSIDKVVIAAVRLLQNNNFSPHGGDIVQVNNQLNLTFTNMKPFIKLIAMIAESYIMKVNTLTSKVCFWYHGINHVANIPLLCFLYALVMTCLESEGYIKSNQFFKYDAKLHKPPLDWCCKWHAVVCLCVSVWVMWFYRGRSKMRSGSLAALNMEKMRGWGVEGWEQYGKGEQLPHLLRPGAQDIFH